MLVAFISTCNAAQKPSTVTETNSRFEKYIGVYSSSAAMDYKFSIETFETFSFSVLDYTVLIKEKGGKLYIRDSSFWGDKVELILESDTDMRMNESNSGVHFTKLKRMRPRDMAKIGQLVLDQGVWNGQPIVDKSWLEESTKKHILTLLPSWHDYGYYWWGRSYRYRGKEYKAISALGSGGQNIIIIKDLNLVVVRTASNFDRGSSMTYLMERFILPAFI